MEMELLRHLLHLDVEDILWMLFPLTQLYSLGMGYWPAWISILQTGGIILVSSSSSSSSSSSATHPKDDYWTTDDLKEGNKDDGRRHPSLDNNSTRTKTTSTRTTTIQRKSYQSKRTSASCCDNGIIMSIVLPTALFSAMSRLDDYWICSAKLASLLCLPSTKSSGNSRNTSKADQASIDLATIVSTLGIVGMAMMVDSQLLHSWKRCLTLVILFLGIKREIEPPLRKATTLGEFRIITWYLTIAAVEWIAHCSGSFIETIILTTRSIVSESDDSSSSSKVSSSRYQLQEYGEFVALSGIIGCGLSSFLIARFLSFLCSQQQQQQQELSDQHNHHHHHHHQQQTQCQQQSKIGRYLPQQKIDFGFWLRLGAHAIGPLIFVECSLLYRYGQEYYYRCDNAEHCYFISSTNSEEKLVDNLLRVRWIWFLWEFLTSDESENSNSNTHTYHYPRYFGLLYWMIALAILGIPTIWWVLSRDDDDDDDDRANDLAKQKKKHENDNNAKMGKIKNYICTDEDNHANHDDNGTPAIQSSSSASFVVIRRKWFHLVAIVLFAPVTWVMPQLMSLGYAVATCILVVVECSQLRTKIPLIQQFYQSFLDKRKEKGGGVVLSHIFLIVGCATPLWIANGCFARSQPSIITNTTREGCVRYLELWGVLCLGVGDSMGACIGKLYGRREWGKNQRTLEGSLAMWLSMAVVVVVGGLVGGGGDLDYLFSWTTILVSTTVVTLLEAFTWQMDNLVLPLAGSAMILTLATTTSSQE